MLLIVLATFQILADLTEVLSRVADVVIVFVAAWALSYLLSPLVNRIDQRTMLNRALSVVVVYIGIAIVLAGTLALAVPGLVGQLNDLIVRAPEYGDRAAREVVALQLRLEQAGLPVNVTDLYGQVPAKISQIAGSIAADALGFVSATANVLFNFTLVLIIAFIMLIDGDHAVAAIHLRVERRASQRGRAAPAERRPFLRWIHPRFAHPRSDLRRRDAADPGPARGAVRRGARRAFGADDDHPVLRPDHRGNPRAGRHAPRRARTCSSGCSC